MGAWIEIKHRLHVLERLHVALFMGAWIEIPDGEMLEGKYPGRTLHGCVD
jgi:hypothetical protein